MTESTRVLNEARAARDQARSLLQTLIEAHQCIETGPGAGVSNLFKRVTGRSSLEASIAATRKAIEIYDRVIAEIEPGRTPSEPADAASQPALRSPILPMTFAAAYASRSA